MRKKSFPHSVVVSTTQGTVSGKVDLAIEQDGTGKVIPLIDGCAREISGVRKYDSVEELYTSLCQWLADIPRDVDGRVIPFSGE